ncbi:hypothetical protein M0R04_07980 [Candidatus Dojkabacteria bacterium]|jgi:hypothetical protein|nr:hypothetical protein [Candidatus Dojkabacteria bacterium]
MPNPNQFPKGATVEPTAVDILAEFVNKGLPIVKIFPYKLPAFSYLLFDIEEYFFDQASGAKELQLKIKALGNGQFDLVMTNDEEALERWEDIYTFHFSTILNVPGDTDTAAHLLAADEIEIADASNLKGIKTSTYIRAELTDTNGKRYSFIAQVDAITDNGSDNYTLNLNRNIPDALAGNEVYRGANMRFREAAIDNSYDLNKRYKYLSYFQTIQGKLTFKTYELSLDRAVYYYNNTSPQFFINSKVNALFEGLLQNEFVHAFLYARNVKERAGIEESETRGLLYSLQDAQTVTGDSFIVDLDPVGGTTDDEKMITALIDNFIMAFESGYYNNEPITAAINTAGLKQLMFMAPSFEEYFGIQMYKETPTSHTGVRDYLSLRVHGIEIEYGTIEFVLFEPFSHFYKDYPIMLLMPKSMVGLYQRKYTKMDSDMKVMVNSGVPTFRFTDVSLLVNPLSGGDEAFVYVGKFEFGLAFAGVYNGAYRVLKNYYSYKWLTRGTTDDDQPLVSVFSV